MNLIKFFKIMIIITLVSIIYIHMQMQIFALAYLGKQKEKLIIDLAERNDMMEYDILKLKSSHYLGEKILKDDSELQFRDKKNVFHLTTRDWEVQQEQQMEDSIPKSKTINLLLSLLPFRSEAEANTQMNRSRNSAKNF